MPELQKNAQYYRNLLDYLHDDIFVIDENFVITDINNSVLQTSGYSRSEVIGNFCHEISHGIGQPCSGVNHQCLHREIFETGNPARTLHQHESKEGDTRWVEIMASPIKDEEGRVTHIIESMRDVTELKNLQDGLIQIQKMESLGTLAGGIAHDFNNILSAMSAIIEARLYSISEADPARDDLVNLREFISKAAKLVAQILAFSRKQALVLKPVNMNRNATSLINLIEKSMPRNIEFRLDLAEDLWLANLDSNQMDQVLMNLYINSRDALSGGGEIKVRTQNVELDDSFCQDHPGANTGRYVLISVSDNGDGIDQETLEKMFDPFFTTKDPGVGTGLGLAVVYGIIKQHHGLIYVSSKPGEGTVVELFLPAMH